jgi:hypothetical protein
MATRSGSSTKPGRDGAARLPQRQDVWQVDARQMSDVSIADSPTPPWITVVVSATDGVILFMRLSQDRPALGEVWEQICTAMRKPEAGEPHRPTEVQLGSDECAGSVRPRLDELGVACRVVPKLDAVDHVIAFLASKMGGPSSLPNLVDVEGMAPEMLGSFFDAAAVYFEQAPWKKVGERPIRIECERFEGGPWYAVLMGQAGMTSGLALYDNLEVLTRLQEADLTPEETAEINSGWAVVFGAEEDLTGGDLAAARRHGWRVAGPRAYPSVYRNDPGLQMRPPTPKELQLLEACLRAVPEFVRKKTRRVDPTDVPVPTAAGEATMRLAWVGW